MRTASLVLLRSATILLCLLCNSVLKAQTTSAAASANSQSALNSQSQQGGAAFADFDTLIDLIQTTVDADWDTDDSIIPFASGVYLDASGVMHRVASAESAPIGPAIKSDNETLRSLLGQMQQSESLRWVSLTQISQAIEHQNLRELATQAATLMLGGLSRIDYLHWDTSQREWYIGGPAGGFELNAQRVPISEKTGLPPVLLEDLMTVASVVFNGRGAFGCTIDPQQERLAELSALIATPNSMKLLQKNPAKFAALIGQTLGPQNLRLINLPDGCPTGVALIAADEHMKRLGLELAGNVPLIQSYWSHSDREPEASPNSMVRWWFAISENPVSMITNDQLDDIDYHLDQSMVRVLSQAEWMNATGQRFNALEHDAAADGFAASFTENFGALQTQFPIYARLRHIFDLAVVCELIRRSNLSNVSDEFKQWKQYQAISTPLGMIDSIVEWRKTKSGSISVVATGGALIDVKSLQVDRKKRDEVGTKPLFSSDKVFDLN